MIKVTPGPSPSHATAIFDGKKYNCVVDSKGKVKAYITDVLTGKFLYHGYLHEAIGGDYSQVSKAIESFVRANSSMPDNRQKAYISGKITGAKNLNREKFEHHESKWYYLGFNPVNPHKIPTDLHPESPWHEWLKRDIKELVDCHRVILLDCWKGSAGAVFEVLIAKRLRIPLYDSQTGMQVKVSYLYLLIKNYYFFLKTLLRN